MFFSGLFRFDKDTNLQLGYDSENKELTEATNTDSEGNVTDLLSGGGGSSDFSTAEVTIVNTLEEEILVILPVLDDNVLRASTDIGAGGTQVLKMPIPTGGAYVTSTFLLGTVSGDIAFEEGVLTITGNGTFTVTGVD